MYVCPICQASYSLQFPVVRCILCGSRVKAIGQQK